VSLELHFAIQSRSAPMVSRFVLFFFAVAAVAMGSTEDPAAAPVRQKNTSDESSTAKQAMVANLRGGGLVTAIPIDHSNSPLPHARIASVEGISSGVAAHHEVTESENDINETGFEDGGGGESTSSSTTPSGGGADSAYACLDQPGWDDDFADHMFTCGLRTLGRTEAAGRCMAESQNVSQACGACLGHLIACGHHCMFQCCGGHCPGAGWCVSCNKNRCSGDFWACAGTIPSYWQD